ncbi:MAG: hypothetical protein HYV77_01345 [Candidatus Wildermuthbacteria bacterium]|nr:hypothetical protein [Candidatus Wildermuthbacteria bacterium]
MDFEEKAQKEAKKHEQESQQFTVWLDEAREKNENYFETVSRIMPIFSEFMQGCSHRKTFLALLAFHTHLSTLKNALIDLSETGNIYSMKVLYRVFLEHWLKGTYIWTRYIEEDTDDVGNEYNSIGKIGEGLKYGNSVKQVSIILDAEAKDLDVWDTLCEYDPKLKELNKKDIINNIKKFEYKNIAKYLADHDAPGGKWVSIVIPEYAELSSFVHGGPDASEEYSQKLYDKRFEEYKGMVRFSFNMCRAYAYSIFMLMLKNVDEEKKKELLPLLYKLRDEKGMV